MAARESPKLSVGVRFSRGVPTSWKRAGVRLNGAASKADGPQGHRGSNPLASAKPMGSSQDGKAPDSESGHAQVRFLPPPPVFLAVAQSDQSICLRSRGSHVRVVPARPPHGRMGERLCRQPAKLLPPMRRLAGSNPAPSANPASLAQWQSGCLTSSVSAVQSRRDAPPNGTVA